MDHRGRGIASFQRHALFVSGLSVMICVCSHLPAGAQETIFGQLVQKALARGNPQVEFLVVDLRNGGTLASTFPDPTKPMPPGSLLKPFVAIGYADSHAGAFPTVTCRGPVDRCWSASGHGPLTLTEALAGSCNAYFLALAADVRPEDIPYLPAPPAGARAETLIGLNAQWLISPNELIRAYGSLLTSPPSAARTAILAGMRASASRGTAVRVRSHEGGVLAKTGTAPCIEEVCKASGDGLVIAAVPIAKPALLLLVRERGTTGAMAAVIAGRILDQLKALRAR